MVTTNILENTDADLEAYVRTAESEALKSFAARVWETIKQYNLYAGAPKTERSERVLGIASRMVDIGEKSGRLTLLAEAYAMMAYALNANEEYARSLPYYERSLEALERLGEWGTASRQRLGLMVALSNLGRCEEAIQVGLEADKWFVSSGDAAGHARLSSNLGSVYMRQDEHSLAFSCQTEALEYFQKSGEAKALAQTHLNIGNSLSFLDRFEESNFHYEQCEEIAGRLGLDDLSAQARYNKTYLFFLRGRYSDSLTSYNQLRLFFQNNRSDRHAGLCDLDQAEIYLMLGLSHEAIELAAKAAAMFDKLDMNYELAKAMAFMAIGRSQARQFGITLDTFVESQRLFEQSGNPYWVGVIDLYRAHVLFSLGRFWEAQSRGISAKVRFEALALSPELLATLILLGHVAIQTRNWKQAHQWSEEAQTVAGRAGKSDLRIAAHCLSAQVAERLQQVAEACTFYDLAAAEIETRQVHRRDDHLTMSVAIGNPDIYESLVALALDNVDMSRIYELCEKAKSKSLLDRLSHHFQSIRGNAEQSLLARVNRLRDELNSHYLRQKKDSVSVTRTAPIGFKEQELVSSLREISAVDPEYISLQRVAVPSLQSVQSSMPDDTTLLEFFVARDEVLALVVCRDRANVVRHLCPVRRIYYLQERLSRSLNRMERPRAAGAIERNPQDADRYLQDLYTELLAPVMNLLTTSRLTIIPHGILHLLPFHAFREGNEFLIDRFDITYSPSSTALYYHLRRPRPEEGTPLIAIGNAESLEREWKAVKALMPDSRVLAGEEFTREAFVREAASANCIHLAADLYLRQDNSMFSGFKLAQSSISALDLFSVPIRTSLLMMTGQIFGVNQAAGAEDWLAVTRGLLYAGARSVIVGLWKPSAEATQEFCERFYPRWISGEDKSSAMRHAMSAVRNKFPHPYYWARNVLIGAPN